MIGQRVQIGVMGMVGRLEVGRRRRRFTSGGNSTQRAGRLIVTEIRALIRKPFVNGGKRSKSQMEKFLIAISTRLGYTKYIHGKGVVGMTTTIQKWGNSQGIRIPKFILESLNWTGSERLVVSAEDDKIIIERAERRKNIKELFADYHEEYTPIEIDWGEPVGDEVW